MKVILDFKSIREPDDITRHLDEMANQARNSLGFFFFSLSKDGSATELVVSLSTLELFGMIIELERNFPQLLLLRQMSSLRRGWLD